jgi:phosphoserine phosphatase
VFIDLDGTLVATDLLWESLVLLVKRSPWLVFQVPFWAARGRSVLKRRLAERVAPNAATLPYREDLLAFLRQLQAEGRVLVLATASDEKWARAVAGQLGIFTDVIASDGRTNRKGSTKLEAIWAWCRSAGLETFAYVGDSSADLPIWRESAEVHVCSPSPQLLAALTRAGSTPQVFGERPSRLRAAWEGMRPKQWVKNLLLFVPLFVGHALGNLDKVLAGVLAFLTFCCCASGVYLLNDLLDIEADRSHPVKRRRPFASGTLPVPWGGALSAGLLAAGLTLAALTLSPLFVGALGLYVALTTLYSLWLKRKVILDVLVLAGLCTLRILAGGVAEGIVVSEWLLAFSLFIFTSLAFAKRYTELARLARAGEWGPKGRE